MSIDLTPVSKIQWAAREEVPRAVRSCPICGLALADAILGKRRHLLTHVAAGELTRQGMYEIENTRRKP